MRLRDAFPHFAPELERLLAASSRHDLVAQIEDLKLASRCGCSDSFCSTFYVTGGRSPLSAEERKDRGPHWQDSQVVEAAEGVVVVDIDQFDRIVGIEVLYRPDVETELAAAIERMRHGL